MKATNLGYILNTLDEKINAEYTDPRISAFTAAAATTTPAPSVDSRLPSSLAPGSLDRLNDNRSSSAAGASSSLALTRVESHIPAHALTGHKGLGAAGASIPHKRANCTTNKPSSLVASRGDVISQGAPSLFASCVMSKPLDPQQPLPLIATPANITGAGGGSSDNNKNNKNKVQEPITRGTQCMMESSVAHLRRMRNKEAAKQSRERKHKQLVDMGKELACSKLRVTEMSLELELLREKNRSLLDIVPRALLKNVERNSSPDFTVPSRHSPGIPLEMLLQSAAAEKPQPSSITIILGSKVEPWLTESLRRIETDEPLDSVSEHQTSLIKALSSPNAIWTLASLMRERPKSESDPELYYQLADIEANIVLVDIPCNKVVFKLTLNTIETLIKYYQDVYRVDAEGKEHHQRLHEDFVQAINRYDFRMRASVLEGLEKDGAGELLCGQSQNVKTRILELMERLSPSPPEDVEPI